MRGPAIAIAAAALSVAGGCGDSENRGYVDRVDAIGRELVATASDLTEDAARGSPASEASRDFARLSRAAERQADELAAIAPPEEAKEGHDRLVTAMLSFAAASRRAADAVSARDPRALKRAARELSPTGPALTDINGAISAINRAL